MYADATKTADTDKVLATTISELGKVDILVNSAGGGIRKPIVPLPGYESAYAEKQKSFYQPTSEEEWRMSIDVNMTTLFLATRAVSPHMLKKRKGKIVNVGSMTGAKGFANQVMYCMTKAAVSMYTRALALEWARYNINVNTLAPGYVSTEIMATTLFENESVRNTLLRSVPLRRFAEPREVALLAVYLASEASNYVTGQTIYIDGGVLA